MSDVLPVPISERLQKELDVSDISVQTTLSGGDVSNACLVSADENVLFVKWDVNGRRDMFESEVQGLMLIAETETVRVPEIYAWGEIEGYVYLVAEAFTEGRKADNFDRQFGEQLACMHKWSMEYFGLHWDNWIGPLPQSNTPHEEWASFFVEERLQPQVKRGRENGCLSEVDVSQFEALYPQLENYFPQEKPALVHGDLWHGNVITDEKGFPVLIDPAVYYGHREVDLAILNLFGHLSPEFYRGYERVYSLADGLEERLSLYNLYPQLIHLNLFGGMFYSTIMETVRKFS